MSERKSINKYYPPDYDPSKPGPKSKPKTSLPSVRLMAPFSMRCLSCEHFIYKGTKFNARKKPTGDKYLGIAIIGFNIRCPRCANDIFFKTDPKTSGYIVVSGAQRNHEPWRQKEAEQESVEDRLDRLEKEKAEKESKYGQAVDALASLEESTAANAAEAERERELARLKSLAERAQVAQAANELSSTHSGNTQLTLATKLEARVMDKVKAKLDLADRPKSVLPALKRRKHLSK